MRKLESGESFSNILLALTLHVFGGQKSSIHNVLGQWHRIQCEYMCDFEGFYSLHMCGGRQVAWNMQHAY